MAKVPKNMALISVADPGCLSRLLDPNFSTPDPGSRIETRKNPGSGSATKNLSIFNLTHKSFTKLSEARDFHPGSSFFLPIRDPGSGGPKSTGSQIRNTGSIKLKTGTNGTRGLKTEGEKCV